MRRNKKIFRPKRRYRIKKRNGNVIKIVTGAAALAVLVFVGYSAAGPISRYIADRSEQSESEPWTPENTDTSAEDPSAQTDVTSASGETSENISAVTEQTSDTAENALQPPAVPDDTISNETTLRNENTSEPENSDVTTAAPEQSAPADLTVREGGSAYILSSSDMTDRETLDNALAELSVSGCSAVILPMKEEGGAFNYATGASLAHTVYEGDDPIRSELTAKEIADAAYDKGLRPVALISVLNDNNRYGDYRDGSYHTLDDDAWLDSSPEKGGKPWLSPFEDETKEYMQDIVTELAEAGFKEIIADDFIFPEFRSSDIELLGDSVSPYSDRYLALTELAKDMTEAGKESGASVMLRITANSIIKDYSELFHPEELSGCTVLVDYSEDNISRTMTAGDTEIVLDDMEMYEKTSAIYGGVAGKCGDLPTYPMIDRYSMSAEDFTQCVKALEALGYDRYYVY